MRDLFLGIVSQLGRIPIVLTQSHRYMYQGPWQLEDMLRLSDMKSRDFSVFRDPCEEY